MARRFLSLVLGSLLLGNLPAASYTLEEIRRPQSRATGISQEGQVVGNGGTYQPMHSPVLFAWEGGIFTEFPDPLLLPDLRQSYATAVNDSGTIVGWATFSAATGPTPSRPRAGFYYHPSSGVVRIYGPENCERVEPTSINNQGVVTGVFYPQVDSSMGEPFLLEDGTAKSLAGIFQMSGMAPVAINDSGAIIANPQPASSDNVPLGIAVLYADGIARKMLPPNCSHSEAVAINESNTVLLRAKLSDETGVRPFLYKDGVYTDLTSLAGGKGFSLECPWAIVNLTQNALNDHGDIVGGIAGRPVLFSGGAFVELEPMVQIGEKRFWPTGITNGGRILAQIFEAVTDTAGHPGVLTYSDEPPPEPEPEPIFERAIYRYVSIGGLGISLTDLSDRNAFVAKVNTSPLMPYLVDKAWDFETGFLWINPPSPHPDVTLLRDLVSIDSAGRVAGYAHPHSQVGGGGAFIFDDGDFTFVPGVAHFVDDDENGKFLGVGRDLESVVIYDADTQLLTTIETLRGMTPYAMNAQGDIVGTKEDATPFLYTSGNVVDLPLLPGGSYAEPIAINSLRTVFLRGDDGVGFTHYFLYRDGTITDLNAIPGLASFRAQASRSALNDSDEVVGAIGIAPSAWWEVPGEGYKAVIYRDGELTEIVLPEDQANAPFSFVPFGRNNKDFMVAGAGMRRNRFPEYGILVRVPDPTPTPEPTPTPDPTPTPAPTSTPEPTVTPGPVPVEPTARPAAPRIHRTGRIFAQPSWVQIRGSGEMGAKVQYRMGNGRFKTVGRGASWKIRLHLEEGRNVVKVRSIAPNGRTSRTKKLVLFVKSAEHLAD